MRVRHRIPSIFTLSMVDVLCCALGCVILLWLLNAKQQEDDALEHDRNTAALEEQTRTERAQAEARLAALRTENERNEARLNALLKSANADRAGAYDRLSAMEARILSLLSEYAVLTKRTDAQKAQLAGLESKLMKSEGRIVVLETEVKNRSALLAEEKTKAANEKDRTTDLSKRLAALEMRLREASGELEVTRKARGEEELQARELRRQLAQRGQEMAALNRSLADLRLASAALRTALTAREQELAKALAFREKWTAAEAKVLALEKRVLAGEQDLTGARRTVASLQADKNALIGEVGKARAAIDARFAGIELTGKRVIFLVDISGSMEMLDDNTPAPIKWLEVRNTVMRLMRSLPNLEKFQIITFSSRANFALGKEDEWLDKTTSPETVGKTLAAIKPKGGTNMYAALEKAFRYRAQGLDTIYLLSDGLPNLGPGMDGPGRELTEIQRGTILGKYVRNTLRDDWNKERPGQARVHINTIGFFYESPDLGAFLWALSRENDGSFVGMSKP